FPGINWGGGPIWPLANPVPFNLQGMQSVWYMTYTTWAFQDSISFSTGRHFMKAGYENWNWFYNGPVGPPYAAFNFSSASTTIPQEQTIGNYTGYSFASYLLGMVNSASLAAPNPLSPHGLYHALYFQDDFKFRPNLTLNLGVRYDYNPLAFESHDRITSWNPYKTDPLVNLPGAYDFAGSCAICTGRRNFGTRDFNNFGPRIGFAWQALKDFTIRGAYTISFIGDDSGTALGSTPGFTTGGMGPDIVGAGSYDLAANALYPWKGLFNWDDGFPQDRYVPPTRNLSYADTLGPAYYVDPRYGIAPYIQQWNLNLQKQLPGKVLLDIGYIGNKGNKLRHPALERINQTPASAISQYGANLPRTITSAADAARYGVPYPYPGFTGTVNSALRQFPQLRSNSTVNTIAGDDGFSNYHSLNLIVNRQFHQGLSIYANWVWSKTIDNMGGAMLDYYNRDLDSLINASDAPHRVKIFVQYQLPLGRNKYFGTGMPRVLDWIVGGWEVSGIGNYSSGNPLGFSGAPAINGWNGGTPRMMVQPGEPGLPLVRGDYDYANRLSKPAANKYFDTSLVSSPAPLTLGSAAPRFAYFRSWGTRSEDLGLRKVFRVKEKYITQVRADFLNAINRHNLPGPNTGITSPYFGYITGNPGGNRVIEGSVKFDF
ncbi:MAG: TonB-dependent receptor, partial [Acidobacteria bacterium]|nr:TonB-dependent receptor [Acidobacteriota bacterium]